MTQRRLEKILTDENLISARDLKTLKRECLATGTPVAKGVLMIGLLDEDELAAVIAAKSHFEIAQKDIVDHIDPEIMEMLDPILIHELGVLPIRLTDNLLTVGVLDPLDLSQRRQLEFFTGHKIKQLIATPTQIQAGLAKLSKKPVPADPNVLESFLRTHSPGLARIFLKRSNPTATQAQTPVETFEGATVDPQSEDLGDPFDTSSEPLADEAAAAPATEELGFDDVPLEASPTKSETPDSTLNLDESLESDVKIDMGAPSPERATIIQNEEEDPDLREDQLGEPIDGQPLDVDSLGDLNPEDDFPEANAQPAAETPKAAAAAPETSMDDILDEGLSVDGPAIDGSGLSEPTVDLDIGDDLTGDVASGPTLGDPQAYDARVDMVTSQFLNSVNKLLVRMSLKSDLKSALNEAAKALSNEKVKAAVVLRDDQSSFVWFTSPEGTLEVQDKSQMKIDATLIKSLRSRMDKNEGWHKFQNVLRKEDSQKLPSFLQSDGEFTTYVTKGAYKAVAVLIAPEEFSSLMGVHSAFTQVLAALLQKK